MRMYWDMLLLMKIRIYIVYMVILNYLYGSNLNTVAIEEF